MKKVLLFLAILFFAVVSYYVTYQCGLASNQQGNTYIKKHMVTSEDGFSRDTVYMGENLIKDVVRDELTAARIGLSYLEVIKGEAIYLKTPVGVCLVDDSIWVVRTTVGGRIIGVKEDGTEIMWHGGYGYVEINKHTGEVYSLKYIK